MLSPDWFLLANIVFATGVIAAKVYLLRRRVLLRTLQPDVAKRAEVVAYRRTGVLIVALSAAYLLTLLPAMLGTHTFLGHDRVAAITLTVVAFTELTLSFVAANAGRKDTEPIASAIRRMNIAMAVIMMALAQSALVTAFGDDGSPTGTSAAVAFGLIAAAIGGGMLRSPSRSSHGGANG